MQAAEWMPAGNTVNFIRNIVSQYNLKAFGITIFPEYEAKEIFLINWEKNVNYDEIIVCKGLIEISNREKIILMTYGKSDCSI